MVHLPRSAAKALLGLGVGLCVLLVRAPQAANEAGPFAPGPVEVELIFKDEKVRLGREIVAYIEFRNRAPDAIVLNVALYTFGDCGLTFETKGPSGRLISQNRVFPGRRLSPYGPQDFRKIEPGRSYRLEIHIDDWVDLTEVGLYSFRVAYWNRYSGRWFGEPVWVGTTSTSAATTIHAVD